MPRSRKPQAERSPTRVPPSSRTSRGDAGGESLRAPSIVSSFAPQVGAGCRLLILGTVPSLRSLEMRQSYAHPYNLFWPFMGLLFDAGPERPYAERIARLHERGVGLWDVLKDCERSGSLDSDIRAHSEVPNDIPGLLEAFPTIRAIALNGAKASQVFLRRIEPRIDPARRGALAVLAMPSTSPANAAMTRDAKFARWRELQRWSLNGAEPGGGA